jgi:hypothetical protein
MNRIGPLYPALTAAGEAITSANAKPAITDRTLLLLAAPSTCGQRIAVVVSLNAIRPSVWILLPRYGASGKAKASV